MDIKVGDRIILELSTFEDRFLGLVADVLAGNRLKVYANLPRAAVDRLAADASALVRYAFDGKLLGFHSRVLGWSSHSETILELAGPKKVFVAEDRKEPRCSCSFPAFVLEGERVVHSVVEDMSASCCRVRLLDQAASASLDGQGGGVRLTFHPFDMGGSGYSVGCSVFKTFMKNGERYVVLQFNNDEPDARKRISGFIEAQVCCNIPGYRG